MSDQIQSPIAESIANLVRERAEGGEYTTVRFASKALGIKQTEVKDNLPAGATLLPSKNGTLSESQIQLAGEEEKETDEMDAVDTSSSVEAIPASTEEVVQKMLPRKARRKVETETKEKEVALDENGNPIPEAEKVICTVCGNPVRRNTIVRRGICPLCFRQLAKNVGMKATQLESLTDEEFDVVVGEELSRRRHLEEYKASRKLTEEQFKAMEGSIIPVKEVFAAAKAAGFGPGRVAQAMGGDRFRHEPLNGFGSVWTPYFYGARNGWYFDVDILNHFSELAKPVKEKTAKTKTGGRTAGVGRTGSRGAAMKPVVEGEEEVAGITLPFDPATEDDGYDEDEDTYYEEEQDEEDEQV